MHKIFTKREPPRELSLVPDQAVTAVSCHMSRSATRTLMPRRHSAIPHRASLTARYSAPCKHGAPPRTRRSLRRSIPRPAPLTTPCRRKARHANRAAPKAPTGYPRHAEGYGATSCLLRGRLTAHKAARSSSAISLKFTPATEPATAVFCSVRAIRARQSAPITSRTNPSRFNGAAAEPTGRPRNRGLG